MLFSTGWESTTCCGIGSEKFSNKSNCTDVACCGKRERYPPSFEGDGPQQRPSIEGSLVRRRVHRSRGCPQPGQSSFQSETRRSICDFLMTIALLVAAVATTYFGPTLLLPGVPRRSSQELNGRAVAANMENSPLPRLHAP